MDGWDLRTCTSYTNRALQICIKRYVPVVRPHPCLLGLSGFVFFNFWVDPSQKKE